jgi:hypothetical protein
MEHLEYAAKGYSLYRVALPPSITNEVNNSTVIYHFNPYVCGWLTLSKRDREKPLKYKALHIVYMYSIYSCGSITISSPKLEQYSLGLLFLCHSTIVPR